jgi:hypothetical protein
MQIAINHLQKKVEELNQRITEAEKVMDEPEMLCDYEFAMNDISNYRFSIMQICQAIEILKNAETLKNKKASTPISLN